MWIKIISSINSFVLWILSSEIFDKFTKLYQNLKQEGIDDVRARDIIQKIEEYYDAHDLSGRNYAYIYPGMNKVMQAVGRVIRDEKDRGMVLLIDERYTTSTYQDLFKKEWNNYEIVLSPDEVTEYVKVFYHLSWQSSF